MQNYFAKERHGEHLILDENETRHLSKTMRMAIGDEITVLDGKGGKFQGVIKEFGKKTTTVEILDIENVPPPKQTLHLFIAPTKNINRMEWLVEKCTELGISHITFINTQRCERNKIRLDRLEKIAVSAAKQAGNPFVPTLSGITSLVKALEMAEADQRFVAHCQTKQLPALGSRLHADKNVSVLVGPEGDFAISEIELAKKHRFIEVSLGSLRLRTETAGLYVSMMFAQKNEGNV